MKGFEIKKKSAVKRGKTRAEKARSYKGVIRYIYVSRELDEAMRSNAKLTGRSISKVAQSALAERFLARSATIHL